MKKEWSKIQVIKIEDSLYPKNLRALENPPKQLYVKGDVSLLEKIGIAVIGSRRCSDYGEKMARKFAREITKVGINVISGMAVGVDAIAHYEAIRNLGKTIAVLPSGLNNVYPEENLNLYNKILKTGGLVVTEYKPDIVANSKRFLERNRIVSGLSLCVVIIEAGFRSGTSVTARIGKKQGKQIFCVPSGLDNKSGIGTNKMIKEGATILSSVGDIIERYPEIKFNPLLQGKTTIKVVKKEYLQVYNAILNRATDIDYIYNQVDETIGEISFKLTMLELEGLIQKLPGGFYKRSF